MSVEEESSSSMECTPRPQRSLGLLSKIFGDEIIIVGSFSEVYKFRKSPLIPLDVVSSGQTCIRPSLKFILLSDDKHSRVH